MTHTFLESSALAKLFMEESGSSQLKKYITASFQADKDCHVASALAMLEVRSAIRRKQRMGLLSREDAVIAIQNLQEFWTGVTSQPLDSEVLKIAEANLDRAGLRTLDAIQLACCMRFAQQHPESRVVFVCCDLELLTTATNEGFPTFNPAAS